MKGVNAGAFPSIHSSQRQRIGIYASTGRTRVLSQITNLRMRCKMADFEIHMMKEDVDEDGLEEVFIEFYYKDELAQSETRGEVDSIPQSVSIVYYSLEEQKYNKVSGKTDVSGNSVHGSEDDQLLIDLATAFANIKPDAFK
jgi:hypothetical protein